ncbi:hypothetical protein HUJ05_001668 [Dendroctonus ponderosae]|nr:hypothetical protein HUJ05_001668 [Dendroctonus ponderosae]
MAKEKWIGEECDEMENIMSKHHLFNIHKKVKEISGIFKKGVPPVLGDNNSKTSVDEEDIKTEWQTFISELFNDDRGLQILLNRIHEAGEGMGIKINESKTKFLVCGRNPHTGAELELNGVEVETVHKFTYLGTIITDQLDPSKEIKRKIAISKTTFLKMR